MDKHEIYFDGACANKKNEDAPTGIGVCYFKNGEPVPARDVAMNMGLGTSNTAEYNGLLNAIALAALVQIDLKRTLEFTIYSDSQLVVNQYNNTWRVSEDRLGRLLQQARELVKELSISFKLKWIPREKNERADWLSKVGLNDSFGLPKFFETEQEAIKFYETCVESRKYDKLWLVDNSELFFGTVETPYEVAMLEPIKEDGAKVIKIYTGIRGQRLGWSIKSMSSGAILPIGRKKFKRWQAIRDAFEHLKGEGVVPDELKVPDVSWKKKEAFCKLYKLVIVEEEL